MDLQLNQITDTQTTVPLNDTLMYLETQSSPKKGKKFTWSSLKSWLFGTAVIGGNNAGDILTTNGQQTVSGKRLNNPAINSNTGINVTSAELDKLAGLSTTATELGYVNGVTAGIQGQFTAHSNTLQQLDNSIDALGGDITALQDEQADLNSSIIALETQAGELIKAIGGRYTLEFTTGPLVTTKNVTESGIS